MTARPEGLYVGELTDTEHHAGGTAVGIDPADLTTHGVIVGMTGSGKTGLGIVALEEALRAGIPILAIDPKGDIADLLLTFPNLATEDFAPWVPAGQDAATVAGQWRDGLTAAGISAADIGALRSAHQLTVYTPGSTAGVPLDIVGSLAPPPSGADAEAVHDEAEAVTQGLLGLVGITSDPMSGREHVLIANLIESAWAAGETLDLATLVVRVGDPPMRKLGVIDIETFFPKSDRTALMLSLNGLLASPSFAAWGSGQPLDIASLLWAPDGSARGSVISIAHLSDGERQLVVSRVLSKLVAWMRSQPGSTTLRVLVYMDEVYGFVPPSAAPPAKKPILTLYKQARAFGVGVILATQNPVDLDYKAISNAGTWLIGRLQTERDKARLLEGLSAADGSTDLSSVGDTIAALAKREFLLHQVGKGAPRSFSVRWAMSYLAGPISKDRIAQLPGMSVPTQPVPTPVTPPAAAPATATATAAPATAAPAPAANAAAPPAPVQDDESLVMPPVADGTIVRYVDPGAPWLSQVGGTSGGRRLQAAVAIRCTLRFDDTASGLADSEVWEAVIPELTDSPTPETAIPLDYDDRDLVTAAPAGTAYVLPVVSLDRSAYFTGIQTALKNWLVANRTTKIQANRKLKLYSRPGESDADFAARCQAAADSQADAEADKIRQRLEAKRDRLKELVDDAQLKAQQLQEQSATSRNSELLSGAGSVLGALFGGRSSVRSISGAVNRVATGRARTQRTNDRVEAALARADQKGADLADIEQQLTDELADIHDKWVDVATTIETLDVALEKSDVTIEQLALVWLPTA